METAQHGMMAKKPEPPEVTNLVIVQNLTEKCHEELVGLLERAERISDRLVGGKPRDAGDASAELVPAGLVEQIGTTARRNLAIASRLERTLVDIQSALGD